MTSETLRGAFDRAAAGLRPLDDPARDDARRLQARLTKPAGALGRLEELSILLAGIAGRCPPPVPVAPAITVFAADHGVARAGVTPWPQEVTAQMVANICAGGAAISVIARHLGARLQVVDVGVCSPLAPHPLLVEKRIRPGTDDLSVGPAMTRTEARLALDTGAALAATTVGEGADLLVTGEMGIGNTTPSAALIAAFTGTPAARCTGRGTGIDDAMLAHKTLLIEARLAGLAGTTDPTALLAGIGGLEIGALAGYIVGGAAARVPVIVDGVIALAALLVAEALAPGVKDHVIAGHRSTEPGATVALDHLGLEPLVDLGLRLGEGSGAALAVPIVAVAARTLGEMATFDGAGVSDRKD